MGKRQKGAWRDRGSTVRLLSLSTLVVIAGCARNHMTSVANPFAVRPYSKILVYVPFDDSRLRQVIEEGFASVGGTGVFIPASQAPFAGAEPSIEETQSLFAENGIEAILVISISDPATNQTRLAPSPSTGCPFGRLEWDCATAAQAGYSSTDPWSSLTTVFNVSTTVYDAVLGSAVWMGTTETRRSANNDLESQFHSFANEIAERTVRRLREDGVLADPHAWVGPYRRSPKSWAVGRRCSTSAIVSRTPRSASTSSRTSTSAASRKPGGTPPPY